MRYSDLVDSLRDTIEDKRSFGSMMNSFYANGGVDEATVRRISDDMWNKERYSDEGLSHKVVVNATRDALRQAFQEFCNEYGRKTLFARIHNAITEDCPELIEEHRNRVANRKSTADLLSTAKGLTSLVLVRQDFPEIEDAWREAYIYEAISGAANS